MVDLHESFEVHEIFRSNNRAIAIAMARAGFYVFPCDQNKRPLVKWREHSTRDIAQIEHWWDRHPEALVAIDVGRAKLVVIDADRHGGPDGVAAIKEMIGGDLLSLSCPISETAGGGIHCFFRQPDGKTLGNAKGALPSGVDVRGHGGYVIAPGSIRLDGSKWRPMEDASDLADAFGEGAIPPLPKIFVDAIEAGKKKDDADSTPISPSQPPKFENRAGERERTWAQAVLDGIVTDLAAVMEGGRNNALNCAAYRMGRIIARDWIAEASVRAALENACRANGLWTSDGVRSVRATLTSGLTAGKASPHEDLPGLEDEEGMARLGERLAEVLTVARNENCSDSADHAQSKAAPNWPDPKPIEAQLPAVKKLTPDMLPNAVRDYIFDVANRQQSPVDFVAVCALCGLATLIGNMVRIKPKRHDDWLITPNIWAAIIGRPSAMKSPALKAALSVIHKMQDELRKTWDQEVKQHRVEAKLDDLEGKDVDRRAKEALKKGDRQGARKILSEQEEAGEEPTCPRLVVNDATVEKLGELLNENPRGLLLVRDELAGWLARMKREEYQSERAFYLEAFDGDGQFTYDRIGRGTIHIENCTLSVVGGVQPSRIAPLVRGAMTGVTDDGLVQRLQLAVWPDDLFDWVWTDRKPNASAKAQYEAAFRELHVYASELSCPVTFQFSDDAQDLFRAWMEEIQTEARGGKISSALESHILKLPKAIAALALIFHLLDGRRDEEIDPIATARALDWADYLRSHASRLYAAGSIAAQDGARLILERRAQLPEKFTSRDVQRKNWAGLSDREAVDDAITILLETHHVFPAPKLSGPLGGRPSDAYFWNLRLNTEN